MTASLERAMVLARQYRPLAAIEVLDALPKRGLRKGSPTLRQTVHVLAAWCHLEINDIATARSYMGRIGKAGAPGGVWRNLLEARLATHAGEYATALQKLTRAARRCTETMHRDGGAFPDLATVYDAMGSAYLHDCSFSNALIWFERALTLRLQRHDLFGQARSLGYMRKLLVLANRWEDAALCCARHLRLAHDLNDDFSACVASNALADVCLSMGKLGRARQHLERAASLADSAHLTKSLPHVQLGLARLHLMWGNAALCFQTAAKAAASFRRQKDCERESKSRLLCAEAAALRHDWRVATAALRQVERLIGNANCLHLRSEHSMVASRVEALRGNRDRSVAFLCEAIRQAYEFSGPARGEVFFGDLVRVFLQAAVTLTDGSWLALLLRVGGFWRYYAVRRNRRGMRKGRFVELRALARGADEVESGPVCALAERGNPLGVHGQLCFAPLANRGFVYGALASTGRTGEARSTLETLSNVGPYLGAVYEKKLSQRDALTGLYNRGQLDLHYKQEVERCRALHRPLAVIMLDVDHFKRFNERYGHDIGDAVLHEIAQVFRTRSRITRTGERGPLFSEDFVARYGGEELVLVAAECDLDEARRAAERIRRSIVAIRIPHGRRRLRVTASLGVGFASGKGDPCKTLKMADQALRLAKMRGRNRVVVKQQ